MVEQGHIPFDAVHPFDGVRRRPGRGRMGSGPAGSRAAWGEPLANRRDMRKPPGRRLAAPRGPMAPNKANSARSVPVRACGENALRRHYQQAKQTQSPRPDGLQPAPGRAIQSQFGPAAAGNPKCEARNPKESGDPTIQTTLTWLGQDRARGGRSGAPNKANRAGEDRKRMITSFYTNGYE